MNRPPLHMFERDLAGLSIPPFQVPSDAPDILRGPPSQYLASQSLGCNAARVQLAGGALNTLLVHPEITPFEQLYRREPDPTMYRDTTSPERPVAFEMGAFRVPANFCLLLFDLRPDIYRFSGMDPYDTVPVEARRFSSALGFQIAIDGRQPGQVEFQLNPAPVQSFQQAFTRQGKNLTQGLPATMIQALGVPNTSEFAIAAANSVANVAGAGNSLLPQRPHRYGPQSVPFTLYVRGTQVVQIRVVVFRQIGTPLAFFEYDIAGMLIPEIWVSAMTECMKPTTFASGGPGSMAGGPR